MSPWRSRWSGVRFSQTADVGAEAARQVELVGRHFEHVDAASAGRLEVERGAADIAADRDVEAGRRQDVADQRGRGRLAVGAGDRDEARLALRLAPQQLDVADDLDAGRLRACPTIGCGFGWVSGTPGDRTRLSSAVPGPVAELGRRARRAPPPRRARFSLSSQTKTVAGAAGDGRAHRRQAAPGQAEDPDRRVRSRCVSGTAILTSASASRGRSAPAPRRRSRSGSRPATPSSRAARSGGGSAPSGRRACRSA